MSYTYLIKTTNAIGLYSLTENIFINKNLILNFTCNYVYYITIIEESKKWYSFKYNKKK